MQSPSSLFYPFPIPPGGKPLPRLHPPSLVPPFSPPLYLDTPTLRILLQLQGPSLGLWRAAEVAALREQVYEPPVLDLGCGDGLVTSLVLKQVEFGVDLDPIALKKATQHGIYNQQFALPVEQAPIPAGSISTVISNSVLEHISNLDEVLETIANLLKPGGKLVFTVPTDRFSQWLVIPSKHYAIKRNQQLCHLNLWASDRWAYHLQKAGFTVETIRPYLQHRWVRLWDALELFQQVQIGDRRIFGLIWRRLPKSLINWLAEQLSHLDFVAPVQGGGQLIVARKVGGSNGDR